MSRRNRPQEPPVTLFSFQDIITSVTGILILVTLMMVLDILNRSAATEATTSPSAEIERENARLRETIAARKEALSQNARVTEALGRTDLAALPSEIEKRRKALDIRKALLAEKRAESARTDERLRAARSAGAEALSRSKSLEREAEEIVRDTANRVVFSSQERTAKTLVLVECSRNGVLVLVNGDPPTRMAFTDARSIHTDSAREQLVAWARGLAPAKYAVVLLIKPSAAGYGREMAEELQKLHLDVGYEPLEEEKTVAG